MSEDPDRAKLIGFLVEQGATAEQLQEAEATGWALDAQRAAITRERTIGFVDLVDYTSRRGC
jgi:hypothetical protein